MGRGVSALGRARAGHGGVEGRRGRHPIEKEIPYHPMPCQCHGLLSIVSHIASVTASCVALSLYSDALLGLLRLETRGYLLLDLSEVISRNSKMTYCKRLAFIFTRGWLRIALI